MDWTTAFGTIVGAVIGIGSTLSVDQVRSRRDRDHQSRSTRQTVYVDYLTALSRSHSNMREVSFRADLDERERYGALHAALDSSGIWRIRQTLALVAPPEIITLAIEAGRAIQTVRDALIADFDIEGEQYKRERAALWLVNADLRHAMREDLGVAGPPDPEIGAVRYSP